MKYFEPDFEISFQEDTLKFSGKMENSEYGKVYDFLKNVNKALRSNVCIIDLHNMIFMNSSSIKLLVRFILDNPIKYKIRTNTEINWQAESIPALVELKPGNISIISGKKN